MTEVSSAAPDADAYPQDDGGVRDFDRISLDQPPFNPNGQPGGGYSFEPITDPALDQHYAGLAQQHDPDAMPGVLGMFQKLPGDGVSDRWRYTPPNIPGAPLTYDGGNPCASWIVSRRIGNTGDFADHNFVVVADSLGGPIRNRFSYGPSQEGGGQLISATGSHDKTDISDLDAWAAVNKPFSGVRAQQIPAPDATVISAGQSLDRYLGTLGHPGSVGYWAIPILPGTANSNTAAASVANRAISRSLGPLNQVYMEPYPGSLAPGWHVRMPGWKP
jgi:hypothetical protein